MRASSTTRPRASTPVSPTAHRLVLAVYEHLQRLFKVRERLEALLQFLSALADLIEEPLALLL